jgi:hypothetical protein
LALVYCWGSAFLSAQEIPRYGATASLGAIESYSPSSHRILVGRARARKTEQAGFLYSHRLKRWSDFLLQYEGLIEPFYQESDQTFTGESMTDAQGQTTTVSFSQPYREIGASDILGYIQSPIFVGQPTPPPIPVVGMRGPRQDTYAFSVLPIGLRLTTFSRGRFQLTLSVDLGALYATRDIPVDQTSRFNFLAQTGPGVEVFLSRKRSFRAEYLYEHLSNANLGSQNPGIDSGAVRVSLNSYR